MGISYIHLIMAVVLPVSILLAAYHFREKLMTDKLKEFDHRKHDSLIDLVRLQDGLRQNDHDIIAELTRRIELDRYKIEYLESELRKAT